MVARRNPHPSSFRSSRSSGRLPRETHLHRWRTDPTGVRRAIPAEKLPICPKIRDSRIRLPGDWSRCLWTAGIAVSSSSVPSGCAPGRGVDSHHVVSLRSASRRRKARPFHRIASIAEVHQHPPAGSTCTDTRGRFRFLSSTSCTYRVNDPCVQSIKRRSFWKLQQKIDVMRKIRKTDVGWYSQDLIFKIVLNTVLRCPWTN